MSWVAVGLQAVKGIGNYYSQKQQFDNAEKRRKMNSALIDDELANSYSENLLRVMQDLTAMKASLEDQRRETMQQKGTAKAMAADAGAEGNSVDLTIGDLEAQGARSMDRMRQQHSWNRNAMKRQRKSLYYQAQRAKAGLASGVKPNGFAHAASTAADMYGAYKTYGGGSNGE